MVLLSGCISIPGPRGPLGTVYTNIQGPVTVGEAATAPNVGRSKGRVILGFTTTQASIQAAMADGAIGRVHHVDYQAKLFLGLFGSYTVIVYGEPGDAAAPAPLPSGPTVETPQYEPPRETAPQAMLGTADVQRALNGLGYSCGRPDGVAGRNTRACIRAFQQNEGLEATGTVDQATSNAIRERSR